MLDNFRPFGNQDSPCPVVEQEHADRVIEQHRWSWDLRPIVQATEAGLDNLRAKLDAERQNLSRLRRAYAQACRHIAMHCEGDPQGVRAQMEASEAAIREFCALLRKRELVLAKLYGALETAIEREDHHRRHRETRVRLRVKL